MKCCLNIFRVKNLEMLCNTQKSTLFWLIYFSNFQMLSTSQILIKNAKSNHNTNYLENVLLKAIYKITFFDRMTGDIRFINGSLVTRHTHIQGLNMGYNFTWCLFYKAGCWCHMKLGLMGFFLPCHAVQRMS